MPAITTAQIEALRAEASEAGDLAMVAICDVAIYGVSADLGRIAATRDERIAAIALGKRGARERCAEAIADAKAME